MSENFRGGIFLTHTVLMINSPCSTFRGCAHLSARNCRRVFVGAHLSARYCRRAFVLRSYVWSPKYLPFKN